MDCKEEAKRELSLYRDRKFSVVSLESKIQELDRWIDLTTGDLQESYRLRKQSMEARLSMVKNWLENMDYCMEKLSAPEKTVLTGFFVDKEKGHLETMGAMLKLGPAGLYKLRNRALSKFATVMFGGIDM